MRLVELNHVLRNGMDPYPGLPRPVIGAVMDHDQSRPRYSDKAEFYLGRVDMPCNIGTYIDAPFHRFREGADLSAIALDRVAALEGVVLDAVGDGGRAVTVAAVANDLRGRAVLVRTGWDTRFGTPAYWEPGPFLSSACLDLLVAAKPILVGVDFWNVDDTNDPSRPAHTRLLGAGILIVEHMANLKALPAAGFRFYAVPLRIERGASFPVRAFAEI